MTVEELEAAFEKHRDQCIEFARIDNPRSKRPDLHAFLLLDSLVSRNMDIVSAAAHDEIYLDVDPEELAAVVTEDQVVELIRCGVMWGQCGLFMFA